MSESEGSFYESPEYVGHALRSKVGMVLAQKFEPAFRYSFCDPAGDEANNLHEFTGGLGIFFYGSQFKWDTNFTVDWYSGAQRTDYIAVSQFQLYF
ncbi:MAG: hypothetical protein JXX29_16445 [Deltaproteobacteria bacterium]|nr:hypothetical protein [Deltaproteobacteria bacterium]MBN2673274.1 hypothetical protein [Deltaproteobacteria bacterium]